MVGEADFGCVDVDRVAFPSSKKFDILARDPVSRSRVCGAFPKGMAREASGRDACPEEHFFDFVDKISPAEWTESAGEKGVGWITRESREKVPKRSN